MKGKNLFSIAVMALGSVLFMSCNTASTPKASLNNSIDSVSYAYGVNLADQGGLIQFMEQMGIIQSASSIEYDYQMRIAAADSLQKQTLQKEMNAKIDSLNKVNAPKLNQFIKGFREAMSGGEEKTAYIQGLSIGSQVSQQMIPQFNQMLFGEDSTKKINKDQLLSGLIGTLKNEQLAISKMDAGVFVNSEVEKAQAREMARQEEELKVQYKDSIAAGDAFLAENAKREGVVTLPSGLQYEILRAGTGAVPADTDRVKVHYHGTLINGVVFDSSVDRGEPATFGVTQVIPGWTEALKLMPVGSKWRLYVPYDLAYGAQDRGTIKPFSNLVFDVELLGIEK
ncbi:MAG: FKBP-type peptidyl-prolyl cis-trans isomerase [Fermentimonas sp.]|nr:FKBP-type peptidyl-prolyl cis-trans isomerase [Proteiniphilum sp.]MDD4009128.1 FKBP-type peptidyl-prolyl cis-trans isomerase [Fermentimonas sp.]MDD4416542.1 FKBP-type peptidyl-prolyl cis-trans isomerase [Proteiniphilum sp.]